MPTSLRERFREVDRIPTVWDTTAPDEIDATRRFHVGRRLAAVSAVAAVLVLATLLALGPGRDRREGPVAHASWLTGPSQASCVEPYSTRTLPNREWAFEGVITGVHAPSDPQSLSPTGATTTVTFHVTRWFWGGSGDTASRETYAVVSSAGELNASVGAEILAAGDAEFLWACGFTQAASEEGRTAFEEAATRRTGS